jgi:Group II intron, maturase-specific domain
MVHGERRHAEALREEVAAVLAPMGLRLAPEKTAVVHLDEGFTFLGFDIRRMRKRGTQKYYVYTKPSKKAIQAIKDKVRTKTYRSTRHMGLDELIASLNRSLAGWANYFRHGVSKAVFSDVDSHAWNRLMRWIRAKYKHGSHRIGMPELRTRAAKSLPGEVRARALLVRAPAPGWQHRASQYLPQNAPGRLADGSNAPGRSGRFGCGDVLRSRPLVTGDSVAASIVPGRCPSAVRADRAIRGGRGGTGDVGPCRPGPTPAEPPRGSARVKIA